MAQELVCLLSFTFALGLQVSLGEHAKKRLLLNDPAIFNSRLAKLESTIQSMDKVIESMNNTFNAKLKSMESSYQANLQTKVRDHERHIQNLTSSLSTLRIGIANQQNTMTQMSQSFQERGATYVRWGKTGCSGTGTKLVYSGYSSGQKFFYGNDYYRGGPSNMLCLPEHPELSNTTAGTNSYIYGSEYDDARFGSGAQNQDVPCALCLSNTSTTVMIPGRKSCFSGWRIEYSGFLASGAYHHAASSFVCIDKQPEFIPGGRSDNNDKTLFITGYKCGSLPCPPYTDDLQVYCVVCSK
ncbi:unnamed protein product [Mytilus edulis]|uniref:Uncharacterized protein n=1 Tax=Mytilus edulis TaxID=6550 RepID=A0A8S3TG64_MYTED|nr:unnamed protein product [Mytilus edulis]